MKNGGRRNVRKQKEIKVSDNYFTLDISLEFYNLKKNHIFRVKRKIGNIRKWVDYILGFQGQSKAAKIQKGKVCHRKFQQEGPF